MKKTLLLVVLSFQIGVSYTQLYKTTWGLRIDDSQFGISFTQKLTKKITVESFADFDQTELRYGANFRLHQKILGRRLSWYRGIGAIGGLLKPKVSFYGASALIGADYKFILLPIVVSFDVNPLFYLSPNHPKWWSMQTVFTIKYVLVKEPKSKIFKKNDEIWQ